MAREIAAAGPLPPSARNAFYVPDGVVYLNCASIAPRLKRVTAAGHAAIDRMAAPWNIHTPDWFRDARALAGAFARLIAAPARCAALVPSVSYGIAAAARNVPVQAGENIVVIDPNRAQRGSVRASRRSFTWYPWRSRHSPKSQNGRQSTSTDSCGRGRMSSLRERSRGDSPPPHPRNAPVTWSG